VLSVKPFTLGKLAGTIYDFPVTGDVLPMHEHDETTNHMTVVARGSFSAHGPAWEKTISAGDVLDWAAHDPHEFVALEPNARLVNIVK
jgi:hypothetical protein